jgi:hypothetical protein
MQEKNPNQGDEKKPGEWPETGKQGGQGDVGKKGGDFGGGQGGQGQQKPREGDSTEDVER